MPDLRSKLQGPLGYAVIGAILLIALVVVLLQGERTPNRDITLGAFYLDTKTGEVFTDKIGTLPPIKAPSGEATGVRALVFACGQCDPLENRFVGYLSRFTDEAKAVMESDTATPLEARDAKFGGRRIKRVGDADWKVWQSEEGAAIIATRDNGRCKGGRVVGCKPTKQDMTGKVIVEQPKLSP